MLVYIIPGITVVVNQNHKSADKRLNRRHRKNIVTKIFKLNEKIKLNFLL